MTEPLPPVLAALAVALLRFVWQGALIGLLAGLGLALLRNARAQARYALASAALAACVLVPVFGLLSMTHEVPDTILLTAGNSAAGQLQPGLVAMPVLVPGASESALRAVLWIWMLGAALLSLRLAGGLWWVRRLRQRSTAALVTEWAPLQAVVDRLAQRMCLGRSPSLCMTAQGESPCTVGWLKPVVLLPAALALRMPASLVEALLAHEVAHIRRHDYLVNLLQSAVEILLFYHPVVWWLSKRMREEREQIADRLAVEALGDAHPLAAALAALDEVQGAGLQLVPAAHGGSVLERIQNLLRPRRRPLAGAALAPLLGLGLAAFAFHTNAHLLPGEPSTGTAPVQLSILQAGEDSFGLVRKDRSGIVMSGRIEDADTIHALRQVIAGDFIWYRREGRSMVIRDPAVLARAAEIWKPADALDRQMRQLDARMQPHQQKVEAIQQRIATLERREPPQHQAIQDATGALQTLADQQLVLAQGRAKLERARQRSDAMQQERLTEDLARLEQDQAELDALMRQQSTRIDFEAERLRESQRPMAQLSGEIEVATAPMQQIGREMEVLGKKIEHTAGAAKAEMRLLIEQSERTGLAENAPALP